MPGQGKPAVMDPEQLALDSPAHTMKETIEPFRWQFKLYCLFLHMANARPSPASGNTSTLWRRLL